jgi:hypothetical protein
MAGMASPVPHGLVLVEYADDSRDARSARCNRFRTFRRASWRRRRHARLSALPRNEHRRETGQRGRKCKERGKRDGAVGRRDLGSHAEQNATPPSSVNDQYGAGDKQRYRKRRYPSTFARPTNP